MFWVLQFGLGIEEHGSGRESAMVVLEAELWSRHVQKPMPGQMSGW